MQLLSHFLQSSLYFFLPRSSRKNAHSLLRYFGIRGMVFTFFLRCLFADLSPKRRNAQNLSEPSFFGAILGVCFRYERLSTDRGIAYHLPQKCAVCRFRVTKKRRIATTLLSCSENCFFYLTSVGLCSATYCLCLNFFNIFCCCL